MSAFGKPSMTFVDVETTGLDWQTDLLLEVGVVVTDSDFQPLGGAQYLIGPPMEASTIEGMPEKVQKMHTENGLFFSLDKGLGIYVSAAEARLISELDAIWGTENDYGPMAGSSVSFDRAFLREWMPELEARFHYRNIDVSTVKELCRRRNPAVFAKVPKKKELHRVHSDIMDTIAELKFYDENFLFVEVMDEG